MKKILIIFCIILLPAYGLTATYTVSQDGSGKDYSAATFNALSGDYSGDTFYFSGTFTTRLDVATTGIYGTNGSPVTFDGYQAGDCDPIGSECASSAILSEGMELGSNSGGPDYVNIQDFRMTCSSSVGTDPCLMLWADVSESDATGWMTNYNIRRNYIYETHGTAFYFARGKYITVDNNKMTHFGQGRDATQMVNFVTHEDLIISNNIIGHDDTGYPSQCTSAEIMELHGIQGALIELNNIYGAPQQSGIRPKEDGYSPYSGDIDDVIIRFNKIHDNGDSGSGKGIYAHTKEGQSIDNVYIYGNNIYNNGIAGVMAGRNVTGYYIWSNIITNNGRYGIETWSTPVSSSFYIYNNTIARNNTLEDTDDARGGVVFTVDNTGVNIKNNIFWNNRPAGAGSKYNQYYGVITPASLEHNTYYNSQGTATWYHDGGTRSLAVMQGTYNFEDDSPAGLIEDSGFTDPDGADITHGTVDDDYTLDGNNIDDGADLSACFSITVQGVEYAPCYEDGLDPNNTDFSSTPPIVNTLKQLDYSNFERGAYIFVGDTEPIRGMSVTGQ